MKTSSNGFDLIKRHEGCRLKAYRCPAGVWTVGYGSTKGVNQWTAITQQQAEVRLRADAETAENAVEKVRYLQKGLKQCQFDALVSFVFNVGCGAFEKSTLRKMIIANPADRAIGSELSKWVNANGRRLPGLVARRADEAKLYFS